MAKLITRDYNKQKVSFYFGTRVFALMESEMGIDDLTQIQKRFSKPKFSDVATMLFLGHENACFKNKTDLIINSVDEIYEFIDEIGIDDAQSILGDGLSSLMDVKGGKGEAKKKAMKT